MGIVHIICATLRPDAEDATTSNAVAQARSLAGAPGVRRLFIGRSTDRLVAVVWLSSRQTLEAFAESPMHMSFIMRGLAPCISGMWSASAETDVPPPDSADTLWVFAVRASDTLFEWQVRHLVASLSLLPGSVAAGNTVEERERYRAGGVVCLAPGQGEAFAEALAAARRDWGDVAAVVEEALVPVVTEGP